MLSPDALATMLLPIALAALTAWAALDQDDRLTVPNRYPVALLALWPVAAAAGFSLPGIVGLALHGAVGAGMLLAGFLAHRMQVMGAGDAKLLAAVGLWAGPALIGPLLAAVALTAGVMAALGLIAAGLRAPADPLPPGYAGAASGRAHRGPSELALALKRTIPLAPAIAIGAVVTTGYLILGAAG